MDLEILKRRNVNQVPKAQVSRRTLPGNVSTEKFFFFIKMAFFVTEHNVEILVRILATVYPLSENREKIPIVPRQMDSPSP